MAIMENAADTLARGLLEAGAVLLRPREPFTWASGWRSPIYCDNRRILSRPGLRGFVAQALCERVRTLYPAADAVAGVATGAIAHGVLAADRLGLPFLYVRPRPKEHGTRSQIEGAWQPGQRVVVIEDLVSTGVSSLSAVAALRAAGLEVLGMVALFTYGFDLARDRFAAEGVALTTLTDYSALVAAARAAGVVRPEDEPVLLAWRTDPSRWGQEPETEER